MATIGERRRAVGIDVAAVCLGDTEIELIAVTKVSHRPIAAQTAHRRAVLHHLAAGSSTISTRSWQMRKHAG